MNFPVPDCLLCVLEAEQDRAAELDTTKLVATMVADPPDADTIMHAVDTCEDLGHLRRMILSLATGFAFALRDLHGGRQAALDELRQEHDAAFDLGEYIPAVCLHTISTGDQR